MFMNLYEFSQTLVVGGVAWLIFVVSKSLPAYLTEKGKNLATKEDINQLTSQVELIRSQFFQVNTVHKVQFEAEFQAYQTLWASGHEAEVAHIRCRSLIVDSADDAKLEFGISQLAYSQMLIRYEPFIPNAVWLSFKALDELFIDAKIDLIHGTPKTPEELFADRRSMREAACVCVEAIKMRLSEVMVVK